MGVYIDMKMPTSCEFCPCKTADAFGGLGCQATGYIPLRRANQSRPEWCPLISVPEPHGRLIDADVLKKVVASAKHMDAGIFNGRLMYSDHLCVGADYDDVCKAIDETPTIIPAEEGDT